MWLCSTREIDSLEHLSITIELISVHNHYGGFGSTGATNEQGVLETMLLTDGVPLQWEFGDTVHDVLSTGGVRGRDQELREDNPSWRFPLLGSPDAPMF